VVHIIKGNVIDQADAMYAPTEAELEAMD